jgi:hypothetical protein
MLKENLENKKAYYQEKISQNEEIINKLLSAKTASNSKERDSKAENKSKKAEPTESQEREMLIGVSKKLDSHITVE